MLLLRGTATIKIDKHIEDIFSFVSNIKNQDLWVEGSSDTELTSEGEINVGSTFEGKYSYSGKTHMISYEVVNFEPPNHFKIKSTKGPFPFESWIDLKELEDQTEISNNIEAGSDHIITSIMFILLKPLLKRQMNKQMKKELQKLKTILDSKSY